MARRVDLTGQRFGRLLVLRPDGQKSNRNYRWACRCDCGTVKTIPAGNLRGGTSQSCGCLQREVAREVRTTHGKKNTPEYRVWIGMRTRCLNPRSTRYADYGGRGIRVCERWGSFETFYADMGPRPSPLHTFTRLDDNGDYAPDNCQWTPPRQVICGHPRRKHCAHGLCRQCYLKRRR